MKKSIWICWTLTAMVAASAACRKGESPPGSGAAATAPAAAGTERAGPAEAAPGADVDWCAEHEVPESLCTRCNPSLSPAFKATGDWCPEHGLPESQCLICNPELRIERPPAKGEVQP